MPSHSNSRHTHREPHRSSHHHRRSHDARSRSPRRPDESRHKRKRSPPPPTVLPYRARTLIKQDFTAYKPLFASYLDIHKQLYLEELEEHEARGRWKSFLSKWNRGELAEGWYDPAMLKKTQDTAASTDAQTAGSISPKRQRRKSPDLRPYKTTQDAGNTKEDSSSDDEIGPALPDSHGRRAGPVIPRREDLELRDEMSAEARSHNISDLRYERKLDRNAQKERLEELAPRADPGSRERALEKKREVTGTLNAFREAKSPGAEEVPEGDLMGDDGIDGYKKRKKEGERKKNEREIRKEEIMRAKAEEREERQAEIRAKEEKTMEMLKAIARERFG
ncbi:hypothetical protein BU16DRAFT_569852 [Lophium mytilinum]|uniref:RNA helicase HEL117 n=1 Tax=Lophium mytilinum TaxID=390894 RepID=A0A6A6R9C7_9PEZI|nr:hypothetical protein BU16DRAFT_569852 [Lophium mytilinum]